MTVDLRLPACAGRLDQRRLTEGDAVSRRRDLDIVGPTGLRGMPELSERSVGASLGPSPMTKR
jgi:hypothetical protein